MGDHQGFLHSYKSEAGGSNVSVLFCHRLVIEQWLLEYAEIVKSSGKKAEKQFLTMFKFVSVKASFK